LPQTEPRLRAFAQRCPRRATSYRGLPLEELEVTLVEVHKHSGDVRRLREKYDSILTEDDERRREIRADQAREFDRIQRMGR